MVMKGFVFMSKYIAKHAKYVSRGKKGFGFFTFILIAFFAILLGFSVFKILSWSKDSNDISAEIADISNVVSVKEVSGNETIVESTEDEANPYWDYIKMNLIDVDFSELSSINSDVSGWIQVNGTNINYPFVQTNNNDYYLTHSFFKESNEAGWVFLDYRNDISSLEKNTIIYAHSRVDTTMFGSLKKLLNSNWYSDKNNHIIKLSSKGQNTLWQVFSVYHIPTTSDYLKIDFDSPEQFSDFAKMLQDRSVYSFNTSVDGNDKILTLSTCYSNGEKMVMHAKLIKYSNK